MSNLSQFFSGGARVWVSGTTYAIGNVVMSPADNYQQYVRITNGAGTTDPSSDTTNYRPHGGRAIKSVQKGELAVGAGATSATATISSVNTSKSILIRLGSKANSATGGNQASFWVNLVHTNSTTITATRETTDGIVTTSWLLVEYY